MKLSPSSKNISHKKWNLGFTLAIAIFIGMVLVAGCTGQSSQPATTPAPVAMTTITVMENTGVPVVGTSALAVVPTGSNLTNAIPEK